MPWTDLEQAYLAGVCEQGQQLGVTREMAARVAARALGKPLATVVTRIYWKGLWKPGGKSRARLPGGCPRARCALEESAARVWQQVFDSKCEGGGG